jgi:hypothetical protein
VEDLGAGGGAVHEVIGDVGGEGAGFAGHRRRVRWRALGDKGIAFKIRCDPFSSSVVDMAGGDDAGLSCHGRRLSWRAGGVNNGS